MVALPVSRRSRVRIRQCLRSLKPCSTEARAADRAWLACRWAGVSLRAAVALSALRLLGRDAEADSLASIARTSSSLDNADREWRDRYRDREPTLIERRDFALLTSGRVRQLDSGMVAGIDGQLHRLLWSYRLGLRRPTCRYRCQQGPGEVRRRGACPRGRTCSEGL